MNATNPSPLPVSRSIQHTGVLLFTTLWFWMGATSASTPSSEGGSFVPDFDWMATWGHELREVSVNAVLSYTAVCIVLFGISLGGQSNFDDQSHRDNVRRGVGVVGTLIAVATLSLAILATATAFAHPTDIPELVVILPTAAVSWILGIEVGRYVVPGHDAQLSSAQKKLAEATARLSRLPTPARSAWTAYLSVLLAAAGGAAIAALITGQSGRAFWFIATTAFIIDFVYLLLFTQLLGDTLGMPESKKRNVTQLGYYAVFAFIIVLVNAYVLVAAELPALTILAALLIQLAAPLLAILRLNFNQQWTIDFSLAAAAAHFAAANLRSQISVLSAGRAAERTGCWPHAAARRFPVLVAGQALTGHGSIGGCVEAVSELRKGSQPFRELGTAQSRELQCRRRRAGLTPSALTPSRPAPARP